MKLPVKATIRKTNSSHVVTIPSDYITNGLFKIGDKVKFLIEKDDDTVEQGEEE